MSDDVAGKTESILDIIEGIDSKTIMLPEFQRDFRWEINQTCDLFDSLIQDIFIGAIIYGKPSFAMSLREIDKRNRKGAGSRQPLKIESYSEAEIKKKADAEHLRIVLDGQQRITSIYRAVTGEGDDKIYVVLKCDLHEKDLPRTKVPWEEIYSEVASEESGEAISIKLSDVYEYESHGLGDEDLKRKFLDSKYGQSLQVDNESAIPRCQHIYRLAVIKIRDLLKESKMVSYYLLNMNIGKFCTFFERSNSRGIQLNFTDILAAKLYQGFNLRQSVDDFKSQNPSVKVNREVLIRTIAYIFCTFSTKSNSVSIEKEFILKNLEYQDFKEHWGSVCDLYVKTLDFLKKNHWIVNQDWMPSENMLIPLMIFLRQVKNFDAISQDQKRFIEYWYWSSTFANRYSTSSNEVIINDCKVLTSVAEGKPINSSLNYFSKLRPLVTEPEDLFSYNKRTSAVYKGVHNLINYCAGKTINWNNTQAVTGKLEDHHIYPKAYITSKPRLDMVQDEAEQLMDSVVNRTLISGGLNVKIGKKAPHIYLEEIHQKNPDLPKCLEKHCIPPELIGDKAWGTSFKQFLEYRARRIFSLIERYAIDPADEMKNKFGTQSSSGILWDLRKAKLQNLINLGLVRVGDVVYIGKHPDKIAKLLDFKNVEYEGQQMTIHDWVQSIIGKKPRSIYEEVYLERTKASIDALRH
jgi:hypothetical protein